MCGSNTYLQDIETLAHRVRQKYNIVSCMKGKVGFLQTFASKTMQYLIVERRLRFLRKSGNLIRE